MTPPKRRRSPSFHMKRFEVAIDKFTLAVADFNAVFTAGQHILLTQMRHKLLAEVARGKPPADVVDAILQEGGGQ